MVLTLDEILDDIRKELDTAFKKWAPFNSPHEAYAITLEEMDELWVEVKKSQKHPEAIPNVRAEAVQVAAMAIRLIFDCCKEGT